MKKLSLQVRRPLLLDLHCGHGDASAGYVAAGFDVVGVHSAPQPTYPYRFVQDDEMIFLSEHGWKFDAIHATFPYRSAPTSARIRRTPRPDPIAEARMLLNDIGHPWVIESTLRAPLVGAVELCGCMFTGSEDYYPRKFETSNEIALPELPHTTHRKRALARKRPGSVTSPPIYTQYVGNHLRALLEQMEEPT